MWREANFQHVVLDVPNSNTSPPPPALLPWCPPSSTPHFLSLILLSSPFSTFYPAFPLWMKGWTVSLSALWTHRTSWESLRCIGNVQWEICHSYWTRPVRYATVRLNFFREISLKHIDHVLRDYLTAIFSSCPVWCPSANLRMSTEMLFLPVILGIPFCQTR